MEFSSADSFQLGILSLQIQSLFSKSRSGCKKISMMSHEDLEKFRDAIPRTTEVGIVRDDVSKLCGDFDALKDGMEERMSRLSRDTAEDLNLARDEMINMASVEIEKFADSHIREKGVTRDEFDSLKGRLEKIIGSDESAERMKMLSGIFNSTQTRVLNWQCQMIKLLKGGLAPDAEADLIVSSGIPIGPCKEFLKKLDDAGVATKKEISAYYVNPEWEWIFSYVDNPDWLQSRLGGSVVKEKDYQEFVKNNVRLIEEGMLLNSAWNYPIKYPEFPCTLVRLIEEGMRSDSLHTENDSFRSSGMEGATSMNLVDSLVLLYKSDLSASASLSFVSFFTSDMQTGTLAQL